jgi:hypothetical protein
MKNQSKIQKVEALNAWLSGTNEPQSFQFVLNIDALPSEEDCTFQINGQLVSAQYFHRKMAIELQKRGKAVGTVPIITIEEPKPLTPDQIREINKALEEEY